MLLIWLINWIILYKKEKATERLFHVDINGMRVLSSLDVAKEVGVRRPMICKIPVTISAKKDLPLILFQ